MLEEVFYTRKDDLKSVEYNIKDGEKRKDDDPVQMKYEMQCLAAGTELIGTLIVENVNKVEESMINATLKKMKEVPFIGGKSAAGHGQVDIQYDELESEETYYNYLEENKEEMRQWIRKLEEALK